ncbi:MAG: N-acetylmuramoyl-L-alanine amidase [Candidatus Pacebacteria bacterium]|nr:N-acetylmuramoyl-L-alanine amidase [Candidatus Paceibacterota bacterium]
MNKKIIKYAKRSFSFLVFLFFMSASLPSSAAVENNPAAPEIIPRSYWKADESQMTWPLEYAKVQKIIIHHTASSTLVPDTDGSGEYTSMVNNIYRYFCQSKEWTDNDGTKYTGYGDMGYNYIIDPNGNIYEGRAGGNGVVGGHSIGFNTGTVGISVIGNYQDGSVGQTNTTLSPAVETALAKLVGWIAANNDININSVSNFYGKNIDGMVGHRDVYNTSCPGNIIYNRLSEIQDNASQYAQAYQKYVYQLQGDSALYVISGGYKTKFASREDLPSTYRDREVKCISASQLKAYPYKDSKVLPDGTLIQQSGEGMVYYLEKGKKRPLSMVESEFSKLGFSFSDIVNVSAVELDYYDTAAAIEYGPDGTLIKDTDNNVYFIENGKKRLFTSATLFNSLRYDWSKIKTDADADNYMSGDAMRYSDGTLVRGSDSPSVYLLESGNKKLFTSGALFERLGYKWSNILIVNPVELNWYPTCGIMIYPDGSLVRGAGTPTVYLVANGQKREITSAALLYQLGYNFASVVDIQQESLSDYPTGAKAVYPDGTLLKSAANPAVYRVLVGKKEEFTSLSVFEATGAKWSNVIEVDKNELDLYATSGVVKYPDGALLRAFNGDKIYVIKEGVGVWVRTADEFTKAGYKWANVLVVDSPELKIYVQGEAAAAATTTETDDIDTEAVTDANTDMNNQPSAPATDVSAPVDNSSTQTQTQPQTETATAEPNIRMAIMGKYADGSLLKATGDSKIYVIKGGQAVLINSAEELTGAGYSFDNVKTIDPKDMAVVLSSNAETTKITANGNYTVEYHEADGKIYKTVQKKGGEQTVVPFIDWEKYIRFVPESDNVILQVLSYHDTFKSSSVTYDDNQFRGVIELKYSPTSKKMWVIEDVPLEGYLRGISEATTRSNPEYLKAFSVITRTYAMNYIVKGGKHTGEPFHLKNSRNGNGNDQQYKGYTFEMRSPGTADSYNQTVGQVIEFNDKPIVAAYSSDSGGVTKSGCTALTSNYCTSDYSYLNGGVKDPANTVHNPSAVAASHGAGMSAVGAYQMAVDGSAWRDIIKYYYLGVNIDKYY